MLIRTLDENSAALRILNTFNESILVFSKYCLINTVGITLNKFKKVPNQLRLVHRLN